MDIQNLGSNSEGSNIEIREIIHKECMVLVGVGNFVVKFLRQSEQSHNSTAHTERAIGTVISYYEHTHGRGHGMGRDIDISRTLRGVTIGLRKLYPTAPMVMVPLHANDMRAIRRIMDTNNFRHVTYWALWASQWQLFMRRSDILRPSDEKDRKWDPTKEYHIRRVKWEDVSKPIMVVSGPK